MGDLIESLHEEAPKDLCVWSFLKSEEGDREEI